METLESLEQFAGKGIVLGLDTMRELLKRLGNPQDKLELIQVAGTNGKGSVTAFLSEILSQAGYRTGRYNSPAVFFPEEIIQTNCKVQDSLDVERNGIGEAFLQQKDQEENKERTFAPITAKAVSEGVKVLRQAAEAMTAEGHPAPTRFELETALAFWYFARKGCQIAVIETGMGGDLDATNVVRNTVCSVLVSISEDHKKILGDTLEEIAAHKAGIIKNGKPAVLMAQSSQVMDTVKSICQGQNSSLVITRPEHSQILESSIGGMVLDYEDWKQISISLAGTFQRDNVLAVLDTVTLLRQAGYMIPDEAVYQGLAQTRWPGRMEVLQKEPLILLDGAHNPDAAEKLAASLENYFTNEQFLYIMGVLADKEYPLVIDRLAPAAAAFVTLTPANSRGLLAEELAETIADRTGKPAEAAESVEQAVEIAHRHSAAGEKIVVCGSLSFLGAFKALWQEEQ